MDGLFTLEWLTDGVARFILLALLLFWYVRATVKIIDRAWLESDVLVSQLLGTFRHVSELLPFTVSPFKLFEFCHTYVTHQCEAL